ncbi:MAG: lipid-A-disaccharide synthase [Paludibacteraceae bacterium]
MRYFLIAGEASGDLHAAHLIEELRKRDSAASFTGLGGDKMREAGCEILVHYREMAYMGIVAVLQNLRKIRANFRTAKAGLLREKPDVLVLIDYPSFNLKMAAFCRKHLPATKIYYYIPPKVWAWKTWRVHRIARLCDEVLGIFPFEPTFYERYGYHCRYVGNPTAEEIAQWKEVNNPPPPPFPLPAKFTPLRVACGDPNRGAGECCKCEKIIAILPGSRKGEISKCLPTMLSAAKAVAEQIAKQEGERYEIVVAGAPGIDDCFYAPYLRDTGIRCTRDTYRLVSQAAAAVVNSGTATLETALLGCPQVAVYHIACSKHLMWLKPLIFSIPYFTLVNLIAEKEAIKELVGGYFTQANIEQELTRLLTEPAYRQHMTEAYQDISRRLTTIPTAQNAAQEICHYKK